MSKDGTQTLKGKMERYLPYSFGMLQDSMPYNFINFYLLIFMTDMAGIDPALAGVVILAATIWDALTNPAIGYLTDNCKSKYGKRRPFIIGSIIPVLFALVLLFAPIDLPDGLKFPYYLIATMFMWTTYNCFSIPFNSFGSEIVKDTNGRNGLRAICGIFTYLGVWFATAGPMLVKNALEGTNVSEKTTWFYSALLFAIIGAIGAFICWRFTRGKEEINVAVVPENNQNMGAGKIKMVFSSYKELLMTRTVRNISLIALVYNTFFAVKATGFVYLMTYNLGLNSAKQALFWTIATVINYISIPVLNIIANKLSKKATFIIMWSIMAIFAAIFFVVQITAFPVLVMYQFIFAFANVCFWVIGYSLVYDCSEVVEFKHGENRSGGIMGLFCFCSKAGFALGGWIAGICLSIMGYEANVSQQSETVTWGINTMMTAVPAVVLLLGIIIMIRFPLNKVKHQKLAAALELKKEGKEYSTDGFDDIF